MSNATPQKLYKLMFTRSQLVLLEKALEKELLEHERGFLHPQPTILKRTYDLIYVHLKPSPAQKKRNFESWVKKIYGGFNETEKVQA